MIESAAKASKLGNRLQQLQVGKYQTDGRLRAIDQCPQAGLREALCLGLLAKVVASHSVSDDAVNEVVHCDAADDDNCDDDDDCDVTLRW